ncbi:unnamed protein product [Arctogadus glacialis]
MEYQGRLESPTRTLTLQAPRGVEINAGVGDFQASCRKDLLLQSSEGEAGKNPESKAETGALHHKEAHLPPKCTSKIERLETTQGEFHKEIRQEPAGPSGALPATKH